MMIMLMNGLESLDNMQIGSTEIITDTLYLSWTFIKHQSYDDKMSEKQQICVKSTGCIDGSKMTPITDSTLIHRMGENKLLFNIP